MYKNKIFKYIFIIALILLVISTVKNFIRLEIEMALYQTALLYSTFIAIRLNSFLNEFTDSSVKVIESLTSTLKKYILVEIEAIEERLGQDGVSPEELNSLKSRKENLNDFLMLQGVLEEKSEQILTRQ